VADNGQITFQPEVILKRTTVKARKGENLTRLAQRYGVSAVSVAGWNKMAVNAALKPGQRITLMLPQRVSVAKATPSKNAPVKKAAATTPARKASPTASKPVKTKAKTATGASKTRVASSGKSEKKN